MAQDNGVLTISNSVLITQLAQMTVTMNAMKAKLKTLASAQTNHARPKRNFYCWSYGRNFTSGSRTCSANKAVLQEEAYHKKIMSGSEMGC